MQWGGGDNWIQCRVLWTKKLALFTDSKGEFLEFVGGVLKLFHT